MRNIVSSTERLAKFCWETAQTGLPDQVEVHAKACVADVLHALLLAVSSPTAKLLKAYLASGGANGPCSAPVLGACNEASAALFNGSLTAVHEIDDVHFDTSLHPGAAVVPAALAASEWAGASPKTFLIAVTLGYEVAARLSIAAGYRHYHYFHSSATCGTLGAAAAAGTAMGLSTEQLQAALGIAATSASGLWEGLTDRAVTVKHLHLGQAAERGIRSARLALLGFPGAPSGLEGPKGFLHAMAHPGIHAPNEDDDPQRIEMILTQGLGNEWAIQRNFFKRYPFCLGVNEPVEGLRRILNENPGVSEHITDILVETSPSVAWMVGNPDPKDENEARFSAPFAMALLLAGFAPDFVPLPVEWLKKKQVRRFLPLIRMQGKEEIGRRKAVVTVQLEDGRSLHACEPLWNLTERDIFQRFAETAEDALAQTGGRLTEIVETLEQQRSLEEMGELLRRIGR